MPPSTAPERFPGAGFAYLTEVFVNYILPQIRSRT